MALSPGDRLGPYEIVAPLGASGMGEVYRAKDTKLGRELAPLDRIGATGFYGARFSADEKAYVYCLDRTLGSLFAVEGLR